MRLVYVNPVGKDSNDIYEYEFFFSDTPDIVWGQDWDYYNPSVCDYLIPSEDTYLEKKILRTPIPFSCAQENSCFSLKHMIDGVICCCHENISNYENYPEPFRIVFKFGEDYDEVESKLAMRHQFFTDILEK